MSDLPSDAIALLRTLGIPSTASELYMTLLSAGAMRVGALGAASNLAPPALAQAVEYLKIFRLVSQDLADGEIVLFASNPRNAWKAHDAYFYWARSLHIGDIENFPSLPEMGDQERRRCYAQLEKVCGSIYDLTHKSISKTTFFWTILDRPAIKGHEAGRAQL